MGPHIFQTCPSANYFDCKAMSIGARSQSARTYLERLMDKFADCEMKIIFSVLIAHEKIPSRTFVSHDQQTFWWLRCVTSSGSNCALIFSGNLNDLVQHGLRALRETLPTEQDLTTKVSPPSSLLCCRIFKVSLMISPSLNGLEEVTSRL